jgi:hypothetical protein
MIENIVSESDIGPIAFMRFTFLGLPSIPFDNQVVWWPPDLML